jgi:UDP-2,4-diacetamido-2,4,6-trideoxy-beta-L-altropyranose hydrolase
MQIAFRVDASRAIGLGHIKRCLSFAEALRVCGARVAFVTRNLGVDVESLASGAGFPTLTLAAPIGDYQMSEGEKTRHSAWAEVDWRSDARDTVAALSSDPPDWLIVDHYSFDARWHLRVAEDTGARIAAIDDLADRPLSADILVDHNLDAADGTKYSGLVLPSTKMCCGPRFALLSGSYRNPRKYAFNERARSIGIFMGGVDVRGLSAMVLRACREAAGFVGFVEVVATKSYPNISELQALAVRSPPTRVSIDLPDLAAFFARHDLQIGAGGGAALERAAIGAPSLVLMAAENQRGVVSALAASDTAATLEPDTPISQKSVGDLVSALIGDADRRRRLADKSSQLVDGRGAVRAALCLLSRELKVRRAEREDSSMMFEWRNHPRTRSVSRNTASLEPESHARWVEAALGDSDRCLLVGYVGDLNVGVLRFDDLGEHLMEVSLYLDPDLLGLGLGKALLLAGEAHVAFVRKHSVRMVATVLGDNLQSQKLFESCGYCVADGRWQKNVTTHEARWG